MVGIKDINSDSTGLSILRSEIYHTATGIQIDAGLIQDNYIHDLGYVSPDHVNGTTSNGGTTQLTIRHNTIFNPHDQTDAVSLFQDFGGQGNRTIDDNLLAGGGYSFYGGQGPTGTFNIHVTNNRFGRLFYPNGGFWALHPCSSREALGTSGPETCGTTPAQPSVRADRPGGRHHGGHPVPRASSDPWSRLDDAGKHSHALSPTVVRRERATLGDLRARPRRRRDLADRAHELIRCVPRG